METYCEWLTNIYVPSGQPNDWIGPIMGLDWTDHGIGLDRSWDWIGPIMGLDWTVNGLNFLWTLMDSLEVS